MEEASDAKAIAAGEKPFDEASIAAMNLVPEAYRGLDRFEARQRIIEDITRAGLAVMMMVESCLDIEIDNQDLMQLATFGDLRRFLADFKPA